MLALACTVVWFVGLLAVVVAGAGAGAVAVAVAAEQQGSMP